MQSIIHTTRLHALVKSKISIEEYNESNTVFKALVNFNSKIIWSLFLQTWVYCAYKIRLHEGAQPGQKAKTRQIWLKNSWNWLVMLNNVNSSLTSFEYEVHANIENGNYVNMLKFTWENSGNDNKWSYFVAGFSYLKPLWRSASQNCLKRRFKFPFAAEEK